MRADIINEAWYPEHSHASPAAVDSPRDHENGAVELWADLTLGQQPWRLGRASSERQNVGDSVGEDADVPVERSFHCLGLVEAAMRVTGNTRACDSPEPRYARVVVVFTEQVCL